jgi:hypothetical protein
MRAFLKLSIAAVAIALLVSGSAFAGTVENGSDSKVTVGGIVWAGIGLVTPFEDAAGNVPTSAWDINNETRLNVHWTQGPITGHWEYWIRSPTGTDQGVNDASNDEIMGWLTWNINESMQLDVGQLEDQSWMERSVDWDMHSGTAYDPGRDPGAYLGFPEDVEGIDFTFKAGAIRAGVALYGKGVVSGAANDSSSSVATTFIPHLEFKSDFMWIAVYFESESVSEAGTIADDPATTDVDESGTDWGSTTDSSNTMLGLSTRFNLGVGTLKVQYLSRDGDSFSDPNTDMALAFLFPMGDNTASLEYDTYDSGVSGVDPKTWLRLAYKIGMGGGSAMQIEYSLGNDGNSSSSRPAVTWIASY